MKKIQKLCSVLLLSLSLFLMQAIPVLAVTEAEVEANGKESTAGNFLIWFMCAIAFLKISQKIDSFMASLGVNVGRTGGSMMAELMIAAKGITSAKHFSGGGMNFRGGSQTNHNASFMSGGLAGVVSRGFTQGAIGSMTGQGGNPISRKIFESSVQKGGTFANDVTGAVAKGNINYTGSMAGLQAAKALSSYMGHTGMAEPPSYSDVEIGGGRIMGTETSVEHPNGTTFGMYQADQYTTPNGKYDTVTTADNSTWYRQYAQDSVERTPYMTGEGKIAYHENLVKKLPDMPKRKDRI